MFKLTAEDLIPEMKRKFEAWSRYTSSNGLQRKMVASYNAYYGNYFHSNAAGLKQTGEQGEFSLLAVNHYRNLIRHIFTMTTQNKAVFDSLAINSDVKSRNATQVSNTVLEYYFYEEKFLEPCKDALEMALYLGTAYLYTQYAPNKEIFGMDGEGQPVYVGGPEFTALSPFDVILDPTKGDFRMQDWVCVRQAVNRYDMIALHPEMEEKILSVEKIEGNQHFMPFWQDDEENIWQYSIYHKSTPNVPQGRFMQYLSDDVVLRDGPNPYKFLPVVECKPFPPAGGAYGHSVGFDLLPLQESLNLLHSTIITNQRAYGVQNVVVAKDAGIQPSEIPGALNILEVNVDDQGKMMKPEVLNLCSTPNEIFIYAQTIVTAMEQVSGVNSSARGNPPPSLTSGTAIALVSTAANTFNASVEQAWNGLLEQGASNLISICQDFVTTEQMMPVVGLSKTSYVASFKADDISAVKRVRVNVGNPLAKTLAGRVEIANNLLNQQQISPQDYLSILQTGQLNQALDNKTQQYNYVLEENDNLAKGIPTQMLATDNHQLHLENHLLLTFRTDLRNNAAVLAEVMNHIQEHIDQLEQMSFQNPTLLSLALQLPLQLPQPQFNGAPGMPGPQGAASPQPPQPGNPAGAPQAPGTPPAADSAAAAAQPGGAEAVAQSGRNRADKQAMKAAQ